jgi:phasin
MPDKSKTPSKPVAGKHAVSKPAVAKPAVARPAALTKPAAKNAKAEKTIKLDLAPVAGKSAAAAKAALTASTSTPAKALATAPAKAEKTLAPELAKPAKPVTSEPAKVAPAAAAAVEPAKVPAAPKSEPAPAPVAKAQPAPAPQPAPAAQPAPVAQPAPAPAARPGVSAPESLTGMAATGLDQAREAYSTFRNSAETFAGSLGASRDVTARGFQEFSTTLIGAFQHQADATFGYLKALGSVRTLSEAIELQSSHARQQFETMTSQAKALAGIASRTATEATEPVRQALDKTLRRAS